IQTGVDLSTLLNVSTRTIRTDIKNINHVLKEYDANIISIKSRGYLLEIYNSNKFDLFKLNNFIEKDNFVDSIIKELLIHSYHSYPLFQQALADKLFTSLSSLKKLLPNVIKKIEKYNLILRADNQDGLLLVGNEEEIRQAIKFFLIDESSSSVNYPDVILPVDHFEKINKEIDSLSSMHTIKLTDDAKRNLGMNILIAISRTEINKFIHYEQEEISNIERTEEYKMALTLQDICKN